MTDPVASDRLLAISHAPPDVRPALSALFALDDRLGDIVRRTREPIVGQMRLTWWHDALGALDTETAPAEPLLRDLQRHLLPRGVTGARLATMIDGWEELIVADSLDADSLDRHALARGAGLFAIAGQALGAGSSPLLAGAGRAWALADLAAHLSSPAPAAIAAARADDALRQAFSARWPASLRSMGVLSLIAGLNRSAGTPIGKAFRVARFRWTGR